MNNVSQVTRDPSDIDQWNEQIALDLIPNNVVLSLCVLFGLIGNALVFLTYSVRSNLQIEDRYFIPMLALADLFASTICGSMAIVWNFMQVKFENKFLCIAGSFLTVTAQAVSVLFLFIISVQRYLKICKSKNMSLKVRRLTVIFIIILAVSLGVWSSFNFGIEAVIFVRKEEHMIGFRCKSVKNQLGGGIIFGATLLFSIVAVMISMLVMYGIIAHKIAAHVKRVKGTISKPQSIEMSEDSTRNLSNTNTNSKARDNTITKVVENLTSPEYSKEDSSIAGKCTIPIRTLHQPKPKRKRNIGHKFTLMFMLITAVFVICYITRTVMMILESLDHSFWNTMSDDKRAGVLFLHRLYIVNSVINPFIYSFLDTLFSEELKKMYWTWKITLKGIFCLQGENEN